MSVRQGLLVFSLLCTVLFCSSPALAAADRVPTVRPSSASSSSDDPAAAAALAPSLPHSTNSEYVLGVGDRIRLTVYGEADLSGEYEIGSTGVVALPLIGDIRAANLPLRSFEQAVRQKLAEGYLRDPRVNAQVVNYRPFFILGEVARPGSYPYVNGMNVLNAVALAGGYTYRADKSGVTVTHANDPNKAEQPAPEESSIVPGDIIRVPERFF